MAKQQVTVPDFIKAVEKLRETQKHYWQSKNKVLIGSIRSYESMVDKMLLELKAKPELNLQPPEKK